MLDYLCGYSVVLPAAFVHTEILELHLDRRMARDVLSALVAQTALLDGVSRGLPI